MLVLPGPTNGQPVNATFSGTTGPFPGVEITIDPGGLVDVISSEDIGKFPDVDLAAAMQRIPGVTISRGVSVMGGVAGLTLNWLAGRLAYAWVSKGAQFKSYEARYAKCHAFANKYAFLLLLVGFFNQAEAVLTLIAGMLKVRLPMFLAIVAIAKAAYFTVYVLS